MTAPIVSPSPQDAVVNENRIRDPWWRWVSRVTSILGGKEPVQLPDYTVAQLGGDRLAASAWKRCIVICTDETGGEVPAFSDGTNWRRVTDRAVIS